ncbi:MAG: AAA family ATPase [Gemmataceae bacterium]|jgi:cell division protease FtsH
MNVIRPEDCPDSLQLTDAIDIAYGSVLGEVIRRLQSGISVLIECEKDLGIPVLVSLRARLKALQPAITTRVIAGRPAAGSDGGPPVSMTTAMYRELMTFVLNPGDNLPVLQHLDLLTSGIGGGVTDLGRDVVNLLYQDPSRVWLAFADPSLPLPEMVANAFPHRVSLLGVPREQIRRLITRSECRKLGAVVPVAQLYKYVSGVNAARLRRLLSAIQGPDLPVSPEAAYRQLRQATLTGALSIPTVDLDRDIGGYDDLKRKIRKEILDILSRRDRVTDDGLTKDLESLLPRGLIFWGPPGTGKTLFAKALASALGAAIQVVSGPELKSKWVGESEENLRKVFLRARQSAPAVIVFDEIDSFAVRRGTHTGSGVEHSMVNMLLTEMDGFRKEELVFVVATTNFVESLDPALLRPGRFEFQLHVPYPDAAARRAILEVHSRTMRLDLTPEGLEHAVRRTRLEVPGAAAGTRYSGDHLNALCRLIARHRLAAGRDDATTVTDVDAALAEGRSVLVLDSAELRVVAGHECGHAVAGLVLAGTQLPERVALGEDLAGSLGYTQVTAGRRVRSVPELLDTVAVLLGGREAEMLLEGQFSLGSGHDLWLATQTARELVEVYGMGGPASGVCHYWKQDGRAERYPDLAPSTREALDAEVKSLLEHQRIRVAKLLAAHKPLVLGMRDQLVLDRAIDARGLAQLVRLLATGLEEVAVRLESLPITTE